MKAEYEPISFGKLSEAIAYLEEGGKLYQMDAGHAYSVWIPAIAENWPVLGPLFTDKKPGPWYEKLNGTQASMVLVGSADGYFAAVRYDDGDGCILCNDDKWHRVDDITPLSKCELLVFMGNAPD